jgi:hypothetical protein
MLTQVDDAIRLTTAVSLRLEQAKETVDQVKSLLRASEQAVQESRKLLAANDVLLGALLASRRELCPEPLTMSQLEDLAQRVAKARGGCAFVWNPSKALPIFISPESASIQ